MTQLNTKRIQGEGREGGTALKSLPIVHFEIFFLFLLKILLSVPPSFHPSIHPFKQASRMSSIAWTGSLDKQAQYEVQMGKHVRPLSC